MNGRFFIMEEKENMKEKSRDERSEMCACSSRFKLYGNR